LLIDTALPCRVTVTLDTFQRRIVAPECRKLPSARRRSIHDIAGRQSPTLRNRLRLGAAISERLAQLGCAIAIDSDQRQLAGCRNQVHHLSEAGNIASAAVEYIEFTGRYE